MPLSVDRPCPNAKPGKGQGKSRRPSDDSVLDRHAPSEGLQKAINSWRCLSAWTAFCFLLSASIIYALIGTRLVLSLDEGIYLHGAQRILAGEHPYADWFIFTGPGTYWLFAALFQTFRASLGAAHGFLALETGLVAGSIYWISTKHAGKLAALAAASSFLALLIVFGHRLYINHRWDNTCGVIVAVALLLSQRPNPILLCLAGVFAGLAIVFTPPTVFVALALGVGLLLIPEYRSRALLFGVGVLLPLAVALAVLTAQHSFEPMRHSFGWASQHYHQANSVPYGFERANPSSSSIDSAEPFWHRALIAIPAALPLLALVLTFVTASQRIRIPASVKLLLAAGLGAVASCYPRWAANQLLFTTPLFLCVLFLLTGKLLADNAIRRVIFGVVALTGLSVLVALTSQPLTVPVRTEVGTVRCTPREARNVEWATTVINPGDTLFVYPYQPIWYSLTGGVNPTSYDFLQPGMMTLEDESNVLNQLLAHPPQWVIWHNLPPRLVLAYWPHSNPATLHFTRLEQFIRSHYAQVRSPDPKFRYAIAIFRRTDPD